MTHTLRSAKRPTIAAAGVAVAALLLAACSSGGSSAPAESAPAASAPAASAAASAPAAAGGIADAAAAVEAVTGPVTWPTITPLSKAVDVKGKNVFIVPIGDAVPVIQAIRTGLESALTQAGAKTTKCDGKFNPTDIANCLKTAVDQKADAVVTMFTEYAMVPTAFDAVAKAGIPILVGGVGESGGKTSDATLAFFPLAGQSSSVAAMAANSALATQGENLHAIVLRLNDSATTTANGDLAIKTITDACPTCTAVPVDFTTPTVDKLPSAVSAAIVANPDANALIAVPEVYLDPAIAGINGAGAQDKISLYGGNGDVAGLQRVKDGKQVSDPSVAPVFVGWQYANALMQLLAGDAVEPISGFDGGRVFTKDNVASLSLTPEDYFTTKWYSDDSSYEQNYLNAWSGK